MAKKQISYKEIELGLKAFQSPIHADEAGFVLLKAFGKTQADIKRYKEGKDIDKSFPGLLVKKLLCSKVCEKQSFVEEMRNIISDRKVKKADPKIILVTDGIDFYAYDTRENEYFEDSFSALADDFDFFKPLAGIDRVHFSAESDADRKASENLAKLHDEIREHNEMKEADLHNLNIFISRLLFCFFAEDTGIFAKNLFTNAVMKTIDGDDLRAFLKDAFKIMDIKGPMRDSKTPNRIMQFPYVNGGLFAKHIPIPLLSAKARNIIIECGSLDWKEINPDIFGSLIQAVANPEKRSELGMHYTSRSNILKVIEPLFLDEIRQLYKNLLSEYESIESPSNSIEQSELIAKKCDKLLMRLSKMKFFDPACGSGNFLTVTYKALREIEMEILALKRRINLESKGEMEFEFPSSTYILLNNFYGIEIEDFPHEVAMLSLWIAEHQMNMILYERFSVDTTALPLKNINTIKCANASQVDWAKVCPRTKDDEVYLFGNPPYIGSKKQTKEQREDVERVFKGVKSGKTLDYIAIWFYLGAKYIAGCPNCKMAFVSSNSICQGEQVPILWPEIFKLNEEISFAHTSFKWGNNATHNANVIVVIISICNKSKSPKYLYKENERHEVSSINPYLSTGTEVIVYTSNKPAEGYPKMIAGCKALDNGNLRLTEKEVQDLKTVHPESAKFIKTILGSDEYINGLKRYCLWIEDEDLEEAMAIPEIAAHVNKNKEYRLTTSNPKLAERAHQFRDYADLSKDRIVIPETSSERRDYIPMGYLSEEPDIVLSDTTRVINDAKPWLFGILTSRMHMVWVDAVCGRQKTDYRYSVSCCYNPFPFPTLTEEKKKEIAAASRNIIRIRARHPEMNLAKLYDPATMPEDLRTSHETLDSIVDHCYAKEGFASNEDRLICLFKLYEKSTKKK